MTSRRRVFVSLRLSEDSEHSASQLKEALEASGISVFLCNPLVGDNLAAHIANAVDDCELFVVLGTEHYGVQGDSAFSTREELQLAVDRRKPIFLIRRCDAFKDPLAQMYLPGSTFHQLWPPSTPMPQDLVDNIRAKLETIPSCPPSTTSDRDPPAPQQRRCVRDRFTAALRFLPS
jgi:hypothetical protein